MGLEENFSEWIMNRFEEYDKKVGFRYIEIRKDVKVEVVFGICVVL